MRESWVNERSKGVEPRRQACSQKNASEFCRGLGCPQQAQRAHRWCAKHGTEYPKGYSVPLLADAVEKLNKRLKI